MILAQTTEQMLTVEALPPLNLAAPALAEGDGDGGGGAFLITILFVGLGAAIGYAIGFERGATTPLRRAQGGGQWT